MADFRDESCSDVEMSSEDNSSVLSSLDTEEEEEEHVEARPTGLQPYQLEPRRVVVHEHDLQHFFSREVRVGSSDWWVIVKYIRRVALIY